MNPFHSTLVTVLKCNDCNDSCRREWETENKKSSEDESRDEISIRTVQGIPTLLSFSLSVSLTCISILHLAHCRLCLSLSACECVYFHPCREGQEKKIQLNSVQLIPLDWTVGVCHALAHAKASFVIALSFTSWMCIQTFLHWLDLSQFVTESSNYH